MEHLKFKKNDINVNCAQEFSVIENLTDINKQVPIIEFKDLPISQDCYNGASLIPQETIDQLENYDLITYYNKSIMVQRYLFGKMLIKDIMKSSTKLLSKPLTKLPYNIYDYALELHKHFLSYTFDRKSSKPPIYHLKKFLKFIMNSSEELKDETYVQVLRQLTDNENYDNYMRVWMFLSIISCCYIPSPELYFSILNFLLIQIKTNSDNNVIQRANYIIIRLIKSFENRRKFIPSEDEIMHIEYMKQIMIPIHFFSNTHIFIASESYTTIDELKIIIFNKLQLNIVRLPFYSLCEICDKKDCFEERFLNEKEKIFDILQKWNIEKEEYSTKKETIEFKIYLKIVLYYNFIEDDIDTITFIYVQIRYEINIGKFKLSEQEIIALASLQLLVDYDEDHVTAYEALKIKIKNYIPQNYFNFHSVAYWIQRIMELYSRLKSKSRSETRLTYLEQIKSSPFWLSHQFNVICTKFNTKEKFPKDCIMAIKPSNIMIFDASKNEIETFNYIEMISWGVSKDEIVIVISKNEGEYLKHYFKSSQTEIIQYLIFSYTNLLIGKDIRDILSRNQASFKTKLSNETLKITKRISTKN